MYTSILYFCTRICYLGTVAIFFTLRFTQVILLKTSVFDRCISKPSYSIVTFVVSIHIHCFQQNLKGQCSAATRFVGLCCIDCDKCVSYIGCSGKLKEITPCGILEAYCLLHSFLRYVVYYYYHILLFVLFFEGLTTKVCLPCAI
jgi:hypothetical protein